MKTRTPCYWLRCTPAAGRPRDRSVRSLPPRRSCRPGWSSAAAGQSAASRYSCATRPTSFGQAMLWRGAAAQPSASLGELGDVLDQVRGPACPSIWRSWGRRAAGAWRGPDRVPHHPGGADQHDPARQRHPGRSEVVLRARIHHGEHHRFGPSRVTGCLRPRVAAPGPAARARCSRGAGLGLAGIAERVASCGGNLTVGPTQPDGFTVTARLLRRDDDPAPRPTAHPGARGRRPGTDGRARGFCVILDTAADSCSRTHPAPTSSPPSAPRRRATPCSPRPSRAA